jgi:hypothetical protein
MPRRKLLTGLALAAGSIAGTLFWRRRAGRRERIDLYFEDGSTISLRDGSPEASTILPLARRILDTARS